MPTEVDGDTARLYVYDLGRVEPDNSQQIAEGIPRRVI
jgi:hypothetical protein